MRTYFLIAIMLLPLAVLAATEQDYDNYSEGSGYASDDSGTNAYLGVDIADVTSDRLSALKLSKEQGVEVTMVDQDGPAGKAGIKEQDVILTMNGTTIESGAQLRRMIHETPAGRVVTLGISRNGQPLTIKAQLGERGKFVAGKSSKPFHFEMPSMPSMPNIPDMDIPVSVVVVHSALRSGLMVENLTPQLGDYFGAKDGHGVLVRSVEKGSRADKAGFRAGDVIVRVDKDTVHDSSDFSHSLQSHRGGPVSIGIIRDKREQSITLSLPERKQLGELFGDEEFEMPDIEANIDLDQLTSEMAKLKPQMEYAISHAMEQARKGLVEQQKQWRDQQRKAQKEIRQQSLEMQRQWRQQQREVERELRELQHNAEI